MISESIQHGNDFLVALTEAGVRHQQSNISNQDAMVIDCEDDGYLLAVADGVGSCRYAIDGAKAAIDAAKKVFEGILSSNISIYTDDPVESFIRYWRGLLSEHMQDECCTTLKCAIKAQNVLCLFSIGDGFIAFSSDAEQIISPQDPHDFGNETDCLCSNTQTSDFWFWRIRLQETMDYTVFACTDGIANGLNEGTELDLIRTINKEILPSQLFEQLIGLFQDISNVSFDDKTMGVVKHDKRHKEPQWHKYNH